MPASSTEADRSHSGKTYRNIFSYASFVLRFACAVLILRSTQPAVLMLESMSFFSLGRCKTPGEQYTNKTLHSRCQTAMPIWCYPEGNLFRGLTGNPAFITVVTRGDGWWRQTGSNRRPEACKATALPTELCPQLLHPQKWWAWEDLNLRPHAYQARALTN